ncbi:MAG TPA: GNAT family N-acetyltransferase [Planctomycetes bacterium]|nr:GNAT family N-acetyltransferase [Planctomycetota bacterium]
MSLIRMATGADRDQLEALHQTYLEVLSQYTDQVEPHALDDGWFTDQGRLSPYVINDGRDLQGYLLVLGPEAARGFGFEVDNYVHELFVHSKQRGRGLAQALLNHILNERAGSWVVEVLEANGPASRYWAHALANRPGLREELRGKFRVYWFQS